MASIGELLPHVVGRIKSTRLRITNGRAGENFKEIHEYLKTLEPEAAAAIACKITFDKVFSTKPKANTCIERHRRNRSGNRKRVHDEVLRNKRARVTS